MFPPAATDHKYSHAPGAYLLTPSALSATSVVAVCSRTGPGGSNVAAHFPGRARGAAAARFHAGLGGDAALLPVGGKAADGRWAVRAAHGAARFHVGGRRWKAHAARSGPRGQLR